MAGLLDVIERLMHPERQGEAYMIAKERGELGNQSLAEQLRQSREGWPVNMDIAQQNLAANRFNLQRAQQEAPLADFLRNVAGLGPNTGAKASLAQNPEWAQQTFGPASVPMQNAQGTLPEVAQNSAQQFYNLGPEMTRQLNYEGERMPFQRELLGITNQNALEQIGEHGRWNVMAAQAGRGATAAEHEKARAAQGISAAMGLLTTSQPMQGANAIMEATPQVKDEQTARTLIGQIGAMRNQLDSVAGMAMSVGTAFGAGPELAVAVQNAISSVKNQLDKAHRELYEKYWGSKAVKGTRTFNPVYDPMSPETWEGYQP